MNELRAAITGVSSFVPTGKLTNQDLEKMVETTGEWISLRTGIKERRIANEQEPTSVMASNAVKSLLEKTSTVPEEVDLLLLTTSTPDYGLAATAVKVATMVGAKNALAFDLNAACSGFLYGMSVAAKYIESQKYKKVVLVGVDKMSSIINYKDRNISIIFGDGGGAALFEPTTEDVGVIDEKLRGDGVGQELLKIHAGGSVKPVDPEAVTNGEQFVYQDGKQVFKYAVSNMRQVTLDILERNNLTKNDIKWFLPHQANKRIIDAIAEGVEIDKEKVLINIDHYGNTTNGTLPLLMADFEHKFKKGDNLILTTFGAGFTWGSIFLKWAYDGKRK